ncbi:MAG TPA: lysophospholipid acyltransferase family protein [Thermoanaerobaculia bacterium]|nr:lysophospholipid acyltransferase family protein [Thermoanaerobaculia bacterium]
MATEHVPPSRLAAAVTTVTGNLYLVLGTVIMSLMALLVALVPPRTAWSFAVARLWSGGLLRASGVRLAVRYDAALEPGRSYVYLANHQSHFDIPALLVATPGQVRMVAKRTLFQIPLFGWAMRAGGFISVDRRDKSTARQTFSAASSRLRTGTSILLFPEGTRSRGDVLLPFQRGGFLLALRSGLPIVPVGVRGSQAVRAAGELTIRPGTIEVCFGAPIHPSDFGLRRKGELTAEVRRRVAELAGLPDESTAEAVDAAADETL